MPMYLRWIRFASWSLFLLAFALLSTAVIAVDPQSLNRIGMGAVFALVFVCLGSGLYLGLIALSQRFLGPERTVAFAGAALRQSVLLASLATALLVLQYLRMLTWWGALLALALMLLVELTFRYVISFRSPR